VEVFNSGVKGLILCHYVTSFQVFFSFLGVSAKFLKATVSFVMFACPSVRMELGFHWTDFHEIGFTVFVSGGQR
jgi:hypothetical protein